MLKKIFSNFGPKAVNVIGWKLIMKMWVGLILNCTKVLKQRNLIPVDKFMSNEKDIIIHHRLGSFKINPYIIDKTIIEGCYSFGSVREIYINDCYFGFHHFSEKEIKTVVDLGANRGMFSTMCTPFADKIVAIEAQSKYMDIIRYNVAELNGFNNLELGNYFISWDNGGFVDNVPIINFEFLVNEFNLNVIDFLKIDIEGSEFKIFNDLPFRSIRYLSMEVHHDFGSPAVLLEILKKNNFDVICATSNFVQTEKNDDIDYIYARNNSNKFYGKLNKEGISRNMLNQ